MNDDVFERDVTDRQQYSVYIFLYNTRQILKKKNMVEWTGFVFKEYFRIILLKTLVFKIPSIWDMRRRVTGQLASDISKAPWLGSFET